MTTSLVHFQAERSHGSIPAALTWFPPGYPLAIAIIPFRPETAGLLVSVVAFSLVTLGIWRLARKLDESKWTARAAVFCWLTSAHALSSGISVLSESLFTAAVLASVLFLVRTDTDPDTLRWLASAAMAGASYWVRYAGLLVVAAWVLMAATFVISRQERRSRFAVLPGLLLLPFLTVPLMVRNVLLVGDWRGGNNTAITRPIRQVLTETPRVIHHLVFGDAKMSQLWLPTVLLLAGLIGFGCFLVICSILGRVPNSRLWSRNRSWWNWKVLLGTLLVYGAGIVAIALRSPISFDPRMYLPVLPLMTVLATCGVARLFRLLPAGVRTLPAALLACSLSGYVAGNFISRNSESLDSFARTEAELSEPESGTGVGLAEFLRHELQPGEVIAGTNGQAAGYVLGHPTLSLDGYPYTLNTWDERRLRSQLAHYNCGHLLIFSDDEVVNQAPFLRALSNGQSPPWLRLAGHTRNVHVYRVELDFNTGAPVRTRSHAL